MKYFLKPGGIKVQATDKEVQEAWIPFDPYISGSREWDRIKNKEEEIKTSYTAGAQVWYQGGGWWLILGYAYDKRDATKALEAIQH